MKKTPLINIMINGEIDHNFTSDVIPDVGDCIVTSKTQPGKMFLVVKKAIDYRQVDEYQDDDPGRGAEVVYLRVESF